MLGFNKARRINDINYPFVFSQMTEIFIFVLIMFLCVLNLSIVGSGPLGAVMTALTTMGFVGLYEASRDVEDPFVFEPNDLPIRRMAYSFNHTLSRVAGNPTALRDFAAELKDEATARAAVAAEDEERERKRAVRLANSPKNSSRVSSPRSTPKGTPKGTPLSTNRGSGTPTVVGMAVEASAS